MGKRISNICLEIVRWVSVILVGYLFLQGLFTLCCIQQVTNHTYFLKNNLATQLLGIALFGVWIRLFLGKRVQDFLRRNGNKLLVAVMILMAGFLGIWVTQTRFWYADDMEKIYQYAGMLLAGDYSGWQPGGYPYMWPHQNGLLLFVAFLLRVLSTNDSFMVLYFLNIVFYMITVFSLYVSWRMLCPDKGIGCVQGFLLAGYLPYGFLCVLLYGNVIGFGWACAAIAMLLRYRQSRKVVWIAGAALCMVFAVIFKQNELIIFVGLLIVLLFDWLERKGERKKAALCILLFILVVLVGIRIPNVLLEHITGFPIEGGNSAFAHLAMGIQVSEEAPGWYNFYNEKIFEECGYDKDLTAQASLASIRQSWSDFVKEPQEAWRFFNRKIASEWNNPTFECFNFQNARGTSVELSSLVKSVINDGGKLNILLIYILDILQSAILFGVLVYLIGEYKMDWGRLLFALLFIGGFVFFTFWEAKGRYVLPFFFMLIPYNALGYQMLWRGGLFNLKIHKRKGKGGGQNSHSIQIRGWNRLHTMLVVMILFVFVVKLSNNSWICNSMKINSDTEAYFEYIHQYNHNFMNLRF